jgi:hypothetical protein
MNSPWQLILVKGEAQELIFNLLVVDSNTLKTWGFEETHGLYINFPIKPLRFSDGGCSNV